jgi:hypothetical protein
MKLKYKISLSAIILLIVVPLLYLIYDRSLIPPVTEYQSPPYVPGETWEQYATRFLATSKKPNALEHYLKAESLFAKDTYYLFNDNYQVDEIINKGWTKPYPEIIELIRFNHAVIKETILGTELKHCEFPPIPFGDKAPRSYIYMDNLKIAKLLIVSGKKAESDKKYQVAMQDYLFALQVGTDIQKFGVNLAPALSSLIILEHSSKALARLISKKVLIAKDYQYLISELARIDRDQLEFITVAQSEFRKPGKVDMEQYNHPFKIAQDYNQASRLGYIAGKLAGSGVKGKDIDNAFSGVNSPKYIFADIYLAGYLFLNKGRILHNSYQFAIDMKTTFAAKDLRELTKLDLKKKIPTDKINQNQAFSVDFIVKTYRDYYNEFVRLRMMQIESALQLYRLEKKKEPNNIDDLKPYLSSIPIDPFADEPFLWSIDTAGLFFAYSVGPDFKDDAAKVTYDPTNGTTSVGDIIP